MPHWVAFPVQVHARIGFTSPRFRGRLLGRGASVAKLCSCSDPSPGKDAPPSFQVGGGWRGESMTGYYCITRGRLFSHPVFTSRNPLSEREAWLWLIEHANFAPQKFRSGYQVLDIPRGSIATHYRALASAWRWDHKRVKRFLILLQNESMVDLETPHRMVHIKLCNYERYQTPWTNEAPAQPQQSPNKAPQMGTKIIKDNTRNKETQYTPAFEDFWKEYPPNDGSKKSAAEAYQRSIMKGTDHETIIEGARNYRAYIQSRPDGRKFTAHASTWLNQERWTINHAVTDESGIDRFLRLERERGAGMSAPA